MSGNKRIARIFFRENVAVHLFSTSASHQHKSKHREANASQHSDKHVVCHSSNDLGHAAHHTERARDGGEDSD